MFLTEEVKDYIRAHARGDSPKEACGLIVFDGKSLSAHKTRNLSDAPNHHSLICPKDYIHIACLGSIVAFYHSHCSQYHNFSEVDKANLRAHNLSAVLYHVPSDSFQEMHPDDKPGYVGRQFEIGKSDCFTLLRDYYKQELNIEIRDYPRDENWATTSPELYDANYEKENFVKVDGSLQLHDCLLFRFVDTPYPSHVAINVGHDFILHHPRNKPSVIERLSHALLRRVTYVVRHKSLL